MICAAVFAPRRPQKPLRKQKDPIAGNSLIYVIAHDQVVRRMGNAILLKNPNPVIAHYFVGQCYPPFGQTGLRL